MKSLFCGIFTFLFVSFANSQTETKISGFVSMKTNDVAHCDFEWARVVMDAKVNNNLVVTIDENFVSNTLTRAFATYAIPERYGMGNVKIVAGRFLSPILYLFPGPRQLELTRWNSVVDQFSPSVTGVGAFITGSDWTLRVGAGKHIVGSLETPIGGIFGEQHNAVGMFAKAPFHDYLNFNIGFSSQGGTQTSMFVQHLATLCNKIHWWGQIEYETGVDRIFSLCGITFIYSTDSFLKLFWDGKSEKIETRITFAF